MLVYLVRKALASIVKPTALNVLSCLTAKCFFQIENFIILNSVFDIRYFFWMTIY